MTSFKEAVSKVAQKLEGWFDSFILMLPNLLIAAVVMGISIFLSRYVSKLTKRLTLKFTTNQTISVILSNVAAAALILVSLFLVLSILHLDQALTSLLAGAGVVGLAVGLALQDPMVNLFSGVMMSVRDLFNIGDLVETNGYFGTIKSIDLRSTIVKLPTGELVTIPNKSVLQAPLKNYNRSGDRKVVLECGVSYGDDLKKVKNVVLNTLKDKGYERDEIEFFYTSFGDSSINFMTRFYVGNHQKNSNYLIARSDAIIAIKSAFDANDISIPFPIRTLDFGIKGGVNLKEAYPRVTYDRASVEN